MDYAGIVFRYPVGVFFFFEASRHAVESTQPPIQWVNKGKGVPLHAKQAQRGGRSIALPTLDPVLEGGGHSHAALPSSTVQDARWVVQVAGLYRPGKSLLHWVSNPGPSSP